MCRSGVILNLALVLLVACTAVTPTTPPTTPPISSTPTSDDAGFTQQREQMVIETIERRGITSENVLDAMRAVPRHLFVPEDRRSRAYGDHPLPIGYGQTISQPYIVALMTDLLELKEGDKVLEIGTGSGYQAAILAEIPGIEVYTIEIIPELAEIAHERLDNQGYANVHSKQGDGYYGWAEHGPFDAIIVTAAPDHVPQPLTEQLANGGRMVVPVGPPGGYQTLWKLVKGANGQLQALNKGGVMFVPFTGPGMQDHGGAGGHEWPSP